MVGELDILSEWIPEQMLPGTIFVLENAAGWAKGTIHFGPYCLARSAAHWAWLRASKSRGCCRSSVVRLAVRPNSLSTTAEWWLENRPDSCPSARDRERMLSFLAFACKEMRLVLDRGEQFSRIPNLRPDRRVVGISHAQCGSSRLLAGLPHPVLSFSGRG